MISHDKLTKRPKIQIATYTYGFIIMVYTKYSHPPKMIDSLCLLSAGRETQVVKTYGPKS